MATSRGIRNNNPGNIERVPGVRWQGEAEQQRDARFVTFSEPQWGIRAIARVLITYQDARRANDGSRIDTVEKFISRWAPPTENDTAAYIRAVKTSLGDAANGTIDVYDWATMRALVLAIIRHENGAQPYDDATIDAGLALAGIRRPDRPATSSPTVWGTVATAAGGVIAAAPAIVDGVLKAAGQAAATQSAIEDTFGEHGRLLGAALAIVSIVGGAIVAYRAWRANQDRLGGAVQ